jgi:hypothetical protein
MRRALFLLLAIGAGAALAEDPAGTVVLELEVGQTAPVTASPGASVLCDDLQVAAAEFTEDGEGFVIRALSPGSTLCGVWKALQVPAGLYRVNVVPRKERGKDEGPGQKPADGGPADAGPADAGG